MASRKNRDGKPIKLVLSWLVGRELADSDIAAALGVDKTYYSRHKDDPEFPSFEDLETLATAFGCDARVLQINFGFRYVNELILLDYRGMHEYMEVGGGNYPHPERAVVRDYVDTVITQLHRARAALPWEEVQNPKDVIVEVAAKATPEENILRTRKYGSIDGHEDRGYG